MSLAEHAVRFDEVERTYRTPTSEVRALREVSLEIERGVITALVGPSGSGKSSLLRLIAGIDRPTSGQVWVEGRSIERASARQRRLLRRRKVGYVYQHPAANFLPDLTVAAHLRVAAGPSRGGAELFDLLESLGIAERAKHLPAALSGGEQQRAAFAQVLATGARVVVADEPTAELDNASASLVIDRMRLLAQGGVTVVVATHDPDVRAAAARTIELVHGRVRTDRDVERPTLGEAAAPRVALRWPGRDLPAWLDGPQAGTALTVRDVSKSFGTGHERVRALRGVSLVAGFGEIVGLVGRSGSGKTTLLNLAAGWDVPDAGEVVVPHGASTGWGDVAYVPQRLGLMDELSIRENVEYPARLVGQLDDLRPLAGALLEAFGLDALAGRYPREASLGEQQRTALARALVLGPSLLLADEPTGHQDAGWARRIFEVLAEAASAGSCVLIATHDATLAPVMDRVLAVADGSIERGG